MASKSSSLKRVDVLVGDEVGLAKLVEITLGVRSVTAREHQLDEQIFKHVLDDDDDDVVRGGDDVLGSKDVDEIDMLWERERVANAMNKKKRQVLSTVLAKDGVQTRKHAIRAACPVARCGKGQRLRALMVDARNVLTTREIVAIRQHQQQTCAFGKVEEYEYGKALHQSRIVSVEEIGGEQVATCDEAGRVCIRNVSQADGAWTFQVDGPVTKMRKSFLDDKIAIGGRENDVAIWELETGKRIFKARNVPHDKLDMRIPVWVTDVAFLNEDDPNLVISCSAYSHLRLYDIRAQRRPIRATTLEDFGHISTMIRENNESVIVADVTGKVGRVNVDTMKANGHFKGFAGGVRDLDIHPSLPLLASCGLDRIVRIHSLNSRKLVGEAYAVQRLNCVKFVDAHHQLEFSNASDSHREPEEQVVVGNGRKKRVRIDDDDEVTDLVA